jgi:hypothetical protein
MLCISRSFHSQMHFMVQIRCVRQMPESLHTLDAGLTMYMQDALQGLMRGEKSRDDLDLQHVMMSSVIRRQSKRDFPCGAICSGLIDSTHCQLSEHKGTIFLLMCILHTADRELILKHELNYQTKHWKKWLEFVKSYLAMEEWFHDSCPKE